MDLDPAAAATAAFQAKIEAGIRAAFILGMDFMQGPIRFTGPDTFSTASIFEKHEFAMECEAGPVERGRTSIPVGWTIYRCPDMDEDERRRFVAGRQDWQRDKWQDSCGRPGCTLCIGCET